MNKRDDFTAYHEELLDGTYDCVDRIVHAAHRIALKGESMRKKRSSLPVPEILTGKIPEILSGLRRETGDESRERRGIRKRRFTTGRRQEA